MRILVMGAGGVGGYIGGRLAASGHEVTLVARGGHLASLQRNGLRIESPLGDWSGVVRATDDPAGGGQVDAVINTTKAYDVAAATRRCLPALRPDTVVLSLQNGVGSAEEIAAIVGPQRTLAGTIWIQTHIPQPGVVRQDSRMQRLALGEYEAERHPRPAAQALAEALRSAGLEVEYTADVRRLQWEKYVSITGMSGITALTRAPVGEIRQVPEAWALMAELMRETAAVGRAAGVPLSEEATDRVLQWLATAHPGLKSSLLRDIEQGKRLEADELAGGVVRLGERYGVPTPANRVVYAYLKLLERFPQPGVLVESADG